MKKLINLRLPFICALALCLGIFSFYKLLFGNVWWLIGSCAALVAMCVAFWLLHKKYWIFCLVALAFVAVGFGNFFRAYIARHENEVTERSGVLSGRVTDLGRNAAEPLNVVYLENCTFEGENLQGRVMIYVYNGAEFETGDKVSVYGTLRNAYAVKRQMATYFVRNRVYYQLTDHKNWITESVEPTLGERVRKYVYRTTSERMPENGDIAYALLTGDRNAMDEIKEESFNEAGILHLLAVSGLHVGFVVTVFGFVIKRLKMPPAAELAVLLVPMIFYAYVCDFSPSVVRAVVMTVCVYVSRMLRGRYDLLTSLSFAALFILLWQPLYLFDVGFQLSVLSVFGISTVYLQIDRLLARRKMPKIVRKLLQSVAMSASCVAATAFVIAYVFKRFVWLGILVNILAIPLVFVSFVLCLAGMIPGVFGYALFAADKILQIVADVAEFVENLGLGISVTTLRMGIFISLALLFVAGGYINLAQRGKKIVYTAGIVLLVICVGLAYVPQNCKTSVAVFCGFDDSAFVATANSGEVAVVCAPDSYNTEDVLDYLSNKRVTSFSLYITNAEDTETEAVKLLWEKYGFEKIYFLDRRANDALSVFCSERGIVSVTATFNQVYGNAVTVQSVYDGGFAGVVVKTGKISVAQVFGGEEKTRHFAEIRADVDFYAVTCAQDYYAEKGLRTFSRYGRAVLDNFGSNKYGNFTITEKSGIITLNFGTRS